MKKFLLPCLMALGMSVSAQTYFSDNFNDQDVSDWTKYDVDGDGKNWGDIFQITDTNNNPVTPVSLISRSWQTTPLTPNNWIVSPAINLTSATGQIDLFWKVQCAAASWDNERYSVYVGTASDITSLQASTVKFTEVYNDPANAGTQYSRSLDVSSFAGQTIYVAFRHHDVTDMDFISIDDVVVKSPETTAPNCTTIVAPANGATGVAVSSTALSWAAVSGADSYDIYLDTNTNPTTLIGNSAGSSYTLTTALASNTTYYWKVVPKNNVGSATGCTVSSFTTKVANLPGCVGNLTPANGASVPSGTVPLTWTAPTTGGAATGYDVYWGTSATTLTKLGTATATNANIINVTPGTYFFQVVATNADGAATGCAINSITAVNPVAPYCGPLSYSTVEPTTYVNMSYNTPNTSSNTVGGTPAHEVFLSKVFKVEKGTNSTITLNANTNGSSFRHYFAVFIDWNQDGDFNDANEKYFTDWTSATVNTHLFITGSNGTGTTVGAANGPVTGTIAIPANAPLGQTRMRVKSAYYGSTLTTGTTATAITNRTNFADPCVTTGSTFGQVEDYTIEVVNAGTLAVNNLSKSAISVYPNPFKDILKISDVKGVKSITVNDMSGRAVKSLEPAAEINLSNLKEGLYIVNLKMEDGSVKTFKAIKK